MSLEQTALNIIKEELDRVSRQIESELKEACPKRSGLTARSIHIEQDTEYSRFVGSTLLSAKYAAEGNGGRSAIITSTRPYDRRGIPPGKLKLDDGSFRTMVHGYKPHSNFVKDVADRHR